MAILHTGFLTAQKEIEEEIEKHNRLPEEYDTTLTAVVYNGSKIVYGHVGDGGIIGLSSFGDFIKVTEVQKGEEYNAVVPLRSGPKWWVFDYSEEEFSSILLLTDGLLDIMIPTLLRGKIYINFVRQFMDVNKLGVTKDNQSEIKGKIEDYLKSKNLDFVGDDKTIVGLVNCDLIPQEKEPSYYEEPDWQTLKEEVRFALYDNEIMKVTPESNKLSDATEEKTDGEVDNLDILDEDGANQVGGTVIGNTNQTELITTVDSINVEDKSSRSSHANIMEKTDNRTKLWAQRILQNTFARSTKCLNDILRKFKLKK
jgi:hypothetical protein